MIDLSPAARAQRIARCHLTFAAAAAAVSPGTPAPEVETAATGVPRTDEVTP